MNENSNFGGNDGLWIFALLILLFGGGGFGFGSHANDATQRAIELNSIQEGQAGIAADVQRGIYEVNATTKDSAYNNLSEIRDVQAAVATNGANIINNLTAMQSNMQNCCCETQRAIDGVNYNLASQSAAIQANDTANTQKILDAITQNRMADMQNQINALQLQNAVCGVVRYPMATTYTSGSNPFCGCGCSSI